MITSVSTVHINTFLALYGLVLRLFEHPDDINFTAVVIMGGAWYWQKFQNSVYSYAEAVVKINVQP